ncbi:MAG: metal ABC transporter ATP-binding protein [Acidimicrobiales bacterium]
MTSQSGVAKAIEVEGLSFYFGPRAVLADVSFAVAKGEFVALAGPNGAGKSTLLRLLLGLLRPGEGRIELLGRGPGAVAPAVSGPSGVGYVRQRPSVPDDLPATAAEVVATGLLGRGGQTRRWWEAPGRGGSRAVMSALEAVGLPDVADRPVTTLSGGQQQRVFIAKALVAGPELLILDEPVAGIDADSQAQFRDTLVGLVSDRSRTVFLVSHDLAAVAEDLDRVLVLKRGRITFDGPGSALAATGVSLGVHANDLPLWLESGA